MAEQILVGIEDVSKGFAGVQALDNVSFEIRSGEVLGLVGENGAGKSTLIKILAGAQQADTGSISIDGSAQIIASERDAERLGLRFIHQDLGIVDRLSVAENVYLGRKFPKRGPFVAKAEMRRRTTEILADFIEVDPRVALSSLSIAQRWLVAIGRACQGNPRLVVMDEPTVALSDTEVVVVKKAIARLKAQGTSVLFVSHRLNEVLEVSDRVTVLKDGNYVGTHDVGTLDREKLVSLIIGEEGGLADAPDLPVVMPDAAVLLEVRDLMGGPLKGINFELRAGEILGIAGLVGSGRTSVLQNIFGAQRPSSGTVIVSGKEVSFRSPYDSVKLGLAMIPEERRAEGLLLRRSIRENVVLAHLKKFRWNKKLPVPSHRLEDQAALKGKEDLSIRMAGTRQLVSQLSGGNQQKVLVARWLADSGLKILILDEPTKGVDVGAKAEIFDIVRELAKQGVGVIMVSSDLEEVAAVCHRAVVLVEGNQVGEVTRPFSDGDILSMCFAGVA